MYIFIYVYYGLLLLSVYFIMLAMHPKPATKKCYLIPLALLVNGYPDCG